MWIICCSSQTKYVVFDIDIFGTQKCHSKTKLDWLGVQSATHTHTHTVPPINDKNNHIWAWYDKH
jgi:hypothetical protein